MLASRRLEVTLARPRSNSEAEIELRREADEVVVEEPLEFRINGAPFAVTMRTPGADAELALGWSLTEGLAASIDEVAGVIACDDNPNAVDVRIASLERESVAPSSGASANPAKVRSLHAYSGCGICGKQSIEDIHLRAPGLGDDTTRVSARLLGELPALLRQQQPLFERTGAVHAAGLFTREGELLCAREDVGRHNALDKVIGWAASAGKLPLRGSIVLLSGRCGFELAQKAWMAGIPIVGSISGPSSLAVELAQRAGMTLACFIRAGQLSIFHGAERIRS